MDAAVLVGLQVLTDSPQSPRKLRGAIVLGLILGVVNTTVFAVTRHMLVEWSVFVAFPLLLVIDGAGLHAAGKLTRRQTSIALGVLTCYWIVREFAAVNLLSG